MSKAKRRGLMCLTPGCDNTLSLNDASPGNKYDPSFQLCTDCKDRRREEDDLGRNTRP